MKLDKKWIIGLAVVGLMVVGGLAVSVLARTDLDRDAGRETQPDADEFLGGWFGASDANAQSVASPTTEVNESGEGLEVNEANGSNEGNESGEGTEVNQANESNEENESAVEGVIVPIAPEQAKQTVLDANPGATVTGVKLEYEGETLVYEVNLDNGKEVYVDPYTGKILTLPEGDDD